MKYYYDMRAVRFQRACYGIVLLFAFVFDNIYLAVAALVLMVLFVILPPDFVPLYRAFFLITGKKPLYCDCSPDEVRFSSVFGSFVLGTGLLVYLLGHKQTGNTIIFLVAFLSVVAGVADFCLGRLVYVWLKGVLQGGKT